MSEPNEAAQGIGAEPLLAGLAVGAARQVLDREEDEQWRKAPDAELALQRAVESALQGARDLWRDDPEERERDGMHQRDAHAVVFLVELGRGGVPGLTEQASAGAEKWRVEAVRAWAEYTQQQRLPGLGSSGAGWQKWAELRKWQKRLARAVGFVLWHGRVRGEVEEERERDLRAPAGLAMHVAVHLQESFWTEGTSLGTAGEGSGRVVELRARSGELLASTPTLRADQVEVLQHGTAKLRSYTGHLTLRRFAEESHRKTRALEPEPSVLGFEGGMAGLAEWLGCRSKKAETDLRDVLIAGQSFHHSWPGGEVGGLWTYALRRAAPGRRGYLETRLGRPLLPYYAMQLGPRERFVVPVVAMPPRVGRDNEWAAQAAFQFSLVRAFVEHRVELVEDGGALLPMAELLRIATTVGLPTSTVGAVLDRWTRDGDDGSKCLEVVEKDRYHLPDNATYRAARGFLNSAGERTMERSKAGQQAPKRRRRRG